MSSTSAQSSQYFIVGAIVKNQSQSCWQALVTHDIEREWSVHQIEHTLQETSIEDCQCRCNELLCRFWKFGRDVLKCCESHTSDVFFEAAFHPQNPPQKSWLLRSCHVRETIWSSWWNLLSTDQQLTSYLTVSWLASGIYHLIKVSSAFNFLGFELWSETLLKTKANSLWQYWTWRFSRAVRQYIAKDMFSLGRTVIKIS